MKSPFGILLKRAFDGFSYCNSSAGPKDIIENLRLGNSGPCGKTPGGCGLLLFPCGLDALLLYMVPMSSFVVPVEMRIKYLNRKLEELGQCRDQVENREFALIKTMAHQMKGNASSFGFPLLVELAKLLEDAALAENPVQTKLILGDVQRAVAGHMNRLLKSEGQNP
jgi:HPt (histidine-containing phosphotransfer) domain-containing protein